MRRMRRRLRPWIIAGWAVALGSMAYQGYFLVVTNGVPWYAVVIAFAGVCGSAFIQGASFGYGKGLSHASRSWQTAVEEQAAVLQKAMDETAHILTEEPRLKMEAYAHLVAHMDREN